MEEEGVQEDVIRGRQIFWSAEAVLRLVFAVHPDYHWSSQQIEPPSQNAMRSDPSIGSVWGAF